ncbi:MAG TPA: site-specific integrase [Vicinamibacterales bacterium]|nr:site-specific integrase [Vicinamibacterales bacterium]
MALLDGRDPKDLQPADDPTIAQLLDGYWGDRSAPGRAQARVIGRTVVGGRPLGEHRLSTVTTDTIKAFQRVRPRVAANRDLALLRAAFNWAIASGIVKASPFRVENVPVVRLAREDARSRRLQPGEDERLRMAAGARLCEIITAAVETGMRMGEILSLQWSQVRFAPRAEIFLPATKTKARRDRRVPISSVLLPVLERRRIDPAGQVLGPDAYVFGDDIGRRRLSIKTAWRLTVRRAKIEDLHFHDLRREAGSRWMDAGIPLATIQRWLGHANISQTSTYLGASIGADELDMHTYEARIGRLTQIDVSRGSEAPDQTASNSEGDEKAKQNAVVH